MIVTHQGPEQKPAAYGLAFKAYEIEELADVYFFRPLGMLIARGAQAVGVTPNQLSFLGAVIGVAAGALLYSAPLALLGFALLIVHGIIDSADGQLARITGKTTELGRILDSVSGHLTFAAIYVAITAAALSRGGSPLILVWAGLAAIANFIQAQLYVYFRAAYEAVVVEGIPPGNYVPKVNVGWITGLVRIYEAVQRHLIGLHGKIESALRARSMNGPLLDDDRARYRSRFYWHVRGWNLLGDNTRFYAVGVLAWFHHLDWFFAFIVGPMNLVLAILWLWQRSADRRFLAELC